MFQVSPDRADLGPELHCCGFDVSAPAQLQDHARLGCRQAQDYLQKMKVRLFIISRIELAKKPDDVAIG